MSNAPTPQEDGMVGFICSESYKIIRDDSDGERWCFQCRKRREFRFKVTTPVDPMSYYGPSPSIECGTCGLVNGDLFPGREREDGR